MTYLSTNLSDTTESISKIKGFTDNVINEIKEIDEINNSEKIQEMSKFVRELKHQRQAIECLKSAEESKIKTFSKGIFLPIAGTCALGLMALSTIPALFLSILEPCQKTREKYLSGFTSSVDLIYKGMLCFRNTFKNGERIKTELANKEKDIKEKVLPKFRIYKLRVDNISKLFTEMTSNVESIDREANNLQTQYKIKIKKKEYNSEVLPDVGFKTVDWQYDTSRIGYHLEHIESYILEKQMEEELKKLEITP